MKLPAVLLAAAISHSAMAVEYTRFQADQSKLEFVSTQMNVPVEGRFKRFNSEIRFDPAEPASGSARIEIPVASIDTGLEEADEEVVGKPWFNAAEFPNAVFESSAVEPLGEDRYRLNGKLTIKGTSREVSTPVTFSTNGSVGVFEGTFTIKRSDYAVGEGIWEDYTVVADEIQIKFRIVAAAAK